MSATDSGIDHLSYSSISSFLECGKRWEYHYIDRLPSIGTPALAFGTAAHATIARAVTGETQAITEVWREEWDKAAAAGEIDWSSDLPAQVCNDGVRLFGDPTVQRTLAALQPAHDEAGAIVERRIEMRVPGVPVPVIGFLDFLGSDGVLRDFKTAGRAWSDGTLREQSQPLVYLAAANQMRLPHTPGRFQHVVVTKARTPQVQLLDSTHTPADVLWMVGVVAQVWRSIEAGRFVPNPKACFAWGRRCEYFDRCRGRA